jgi:hypothetical protein
MNFLLSSSGVSAEGLHLDLALTGIGTSYGIYLKTTVTSNVVSGVRYGMLVIAQNSSTGAQVGGNITEAIEASLIIDATVTNHQEAYTMCLRMTNNSNANGVAAYLRIRDAGTAMADYFFNAPNWVAGTGLFSTAGMRCLVGSGVVTQHIPMSLGLPSTTAYYGRGSTGTPETLATATTTGIGLFLTTAANSGTPYGMTIEITKTGTASFPGALCLKAVTTNATVAGGLYGLMCTVQNSSTGAQTGANIMEAGEFHCIIDATVTNHQEAYSLCLKMTNNSNLNGVAAYLRIRDAGSSMADYLFNAPNWVVDTTLFVTNTHAVSHGIKVLIGGVIYYLMVADDHS